MKERPILFRGEMVRAILEGRKTQTRRIVTAHHIHGGTRKPTTDDLAAVGDFRPTRGGTPGAFLGAYPGVSIGEPRCPYGVHGDRLWVRESHWRFTGLAPAPSNFVAAPSGDPYQARCYDDHPELAGMNAGATVLRVPSIHMPRWASRLTLELTAVRVQRLHEISEEDAKAEGVDGYVVGEGTVRRGALIVEPGYWHPRFFRAGFEDLWSRVNAKRAPWESNPWLWVLTFRVAA
jgi:hypothetical protein